MENLTFNEKLEAIKVLSILEENLRMQGDFDNARVVHEKIMRLVNWLY